MQQPRRDEQQHRIVEVGPEAAGAPVRSAVRRSDSRISALNAASTVPT